MIRATIIGLGPFVTGALRSIFVCRKGLALLLKQSFDSCYLYLSARLGVKVGM